jgi:uncharacterized protein YhdP
MGMVLVHGVLQSVNNGTPAPLSKRAKSSLTHASRCHSTQNGFTATGALKYEVAPK